MPRTLGGLPAIRGAWALPGRSFRDGKTGDPRMKTLAPAIAAVGLFALAACNNTPAENAAANIEAAGENEADALEDQAANTSNDAAADSLENQADAVEESADNRADAVENAGQ